MGGDTPARKPRSAAEPRKPVELFAHGPHLDELSRDLRARAAALLVRPSGRGLRIEVLGAGVGALLAAWACSGVYQVDADQTGVVTRLGLAASVVGPGLHYHLPAPIASVRILQTAGVNRLEIGPPQSAAGGSDGAHPLLTRDGKLVNVAASVHWRITDPLRYVMRGADQDASLRMAAQAALSEVVAQTPLPDILGPARRRVETQATSLLRRTVTREDAGVEVLDVQVHDVRPPEGADAGFHAVTDANVEAQAALNAAEAYRSRVVADAHGDAAKMVQASQGYRDQEVSEAKGEAERFALVDAQYRKAPDVTRERLYSETMERVLHNVRKVVVQSPKDGGGQIVLPAEAFRGKGGETGSLPPAQAQPAQGGSDASAAQAPGQAAQASGSAPQSAPAAAAPATPATAGGAQTGGGVA